MLIYNVKKLHLQANICEVFSENKKHNYCGDSFSLGLAVLQKTVVSH